VLEPSEFAFDGAAALVELAPPVGVAGHERMDAAGLDPPLGGLAFLELRDLD
jgi:hypothetical protein